MSAKSEYEAAYFTLLRAREERDDLMRYSEYLEREDERLDAFADDMHTLAEPIPAKMRRPVDQTAKPLLEAVGRRRAALADERRRQQRRIANAESFVAECEAELAALRL